MPYFDTYRSPDGSSGGGGGGGGGDITAVSAGNGLTGGGDTGDVSLAVLAANTSVTVSGSGVNVNLANAFNWTAAHTFNLGTSQSTAILLDMAQPNSNGQRDSHILAIRGTAYDGTGHNADWQMYADVTSNAGASTLTVKSRIDVAGFTSRLTLTDAGALAVASVTASSLTSGRVTFAGTSGLLSDASTLTFNSGTGALSATSFTASGLTSGRVTFAGTSGLLSDAATLLFNSGTGALSTTSLTASALTSGRVTFAGSSGLLSDASTLTFNSGTGLLSATGFSGTTVTASSLTAGRVTFAGVSGLLSDASTLTFNSGTGALSATSLQATGLTSGRIPFSGASGLLGDDAGLTYATATGAVVQASDSGTATLLTAFAIQHATSGTAAVGIGSGLELRTQNSSGSQSIAGRIVGQLRGVTLGSENGNILVQNSISGTLTTGAWLTGTGNWYAVTGLNIGTMGANGTATTTAAINITSNMLTYTSSLAANGGHSFAGTANTSGARNFFVISPSANTATTLSTEKSGFVYNTYINTWATGALTTQREILFSAPTYAFAGSSTITTAATVAISAAPIAGTNATITNSYALWVQAGTTRLDALLDLSGIAAGASNIKITKTSDTPTTTFSAVNATNAAPSGFMEVTENGTSKYIPFYT